MNRAFGAHVAGCVTSVERYKSIHKNCQKQTKVQKFCTFPLEIVKT
jgi:hypothetical protein